MMPLAWDTLNVNKSHVKANKIKNTINDAFGLGHSERE